MQPAGARLASIHFAECATGIPNHKKAGVSL